MIEVESPYVVVIDTREQRPFSFARPIKVARNRLCKVRYKIGTLDTGDYSIEGHEKTVAVERKSLADLFGTLGRGRSRFQRELSRATNRDFFAIVVESELSEILSSPPKFSKLNPLTVFHTVLSWSVKYPARWFFCPGRDAAEATTIWLLERFYRHRLAAPSDGPKGS